MDAAALTIKPEPTICPSCANTFMQPFVCTTCGAQKLHDATLDALQTSLAAANRRITELEAQNAALREEAERHKKFANARRKELRRLNKYLGPYWVGFTKGMHAQAEMKLRSTMIQTFGWDKVHAAEVAAIDAARKA